MKLNIKYIAIGFFVLFITVTCFVYLYFLNTKNVKVLHCNGVHYTYNKNYSIKSNIEISFDRNDGFMILNGIVTKDGISAHLARKLLFTISDIDNKVVLTFTGIEVSVADEIDKSNLQVILPNFMSTIGSNLLISIYKINDNNYIVESNGIASFLCNNDD